MINILTLCILLITACSFTKTENTTKNTTENITNNEQDATIDAPKTLEEKELERIREILPPIL